MRKWTSKDDYRYMRQQFPQYFRKVVEIGHIPVIQHNQTSKEKLAAEVEKATMALLVEVIEKFRQGDIT